MVCIYITVTEKFPTSTPYPKPLTAATPKSRRNSSENKESSRSPPPSSHTLSLSLSLSLSIYLLLLRYTCTPIYNERSMWGMGFPRNCKENKKADCESWNIYCTVGFLFTFIIFHLVFTLQQQPVVVVTMSIRSSETRTTKYVRRAHSRGYKDCCSSFLYCFRRLFIYV